MKALSKIIMVILLMASFVSCSKNGKHEYVDLGLPSGTLWATCNVGANSPEEFGDYFAWGETKTKDVYNWKTYKHANGDADKLTKYCNDADYGYNGFTDNLSVLQPEDDAATANWGFQWRTPTEEQWNELREYTKCITTKQNDVSGYLFTASNGNTLFLPAAGYRSDDELRRDETDGVWSSSISSTVYIADYFFGFSEGEGGFRCIGYPVRPVYEKSDDEPETTSNKKVEVSSKNMYKDFSKAIKNKGYLHFSTEYCRYSSDSEPYHMVFFPFVYSEDGLEGIMYLVSYNNRSASVAFFSDYQVVGDYLRLSNIIQMSNNTRANPKIYRISKSDGKLRLEGRFIQKKTRSINTEVTDPLPKFIVNALESEDYNFHSY